MHVKMRCKKVIEEVNEGKSITRTAVLARVITGPSEQPILLGDVSVYTYNAPMPFVAGREYQLSIEEVDK